VPSRDALFGGERDTFVVHTPSAHTSTRTRRARARIVRVFPRSRADRPHPVSRRRSPRPSHPERVRFVRET
jgi:hypothetical protein